MPARPEAKKDEEPTEEDEERMLMYMAQQDKTALKAGVPTFLYVGRISDAQLAEARAKAFGKARKSAQTVADATGRKLGSLVSVSSHAAATNVSDRYGQMNYYMMRSMGQALGSVAAAADPSESVSPSLRKLVFTVSVTAGFEFAKAE